MTGLGSVEKRICLFKPLLPLFKLTICFFFSRDTNKRPRLSRVDGPVQPLSAGSVDRRTDNPLLEDIERRAIKAIQERRKALPVTASVSITTNIWANEITLEIATQMVHDVRANVKANRRGCSVCYMISGEEVTDHKSGARCRKMPLTSTTSGWSDFKDNLYFVDGVLCWHCLLPTVSVLSNIFESWHSLY